MDYIDKLKKNGRIIAVAYCRYSSDMQREESIEAQKRAIHNFAKAKGIEIIEEYIDRAQSATSADRPAFQKMLSDAQDRRFNLVLVHKLDRFSRDRYVAMVSRTELMKNAVRVYSVTEQLDDSPESALMESLLDGMAEFYSRNLAREVEKGKRENALKCRHVGGIPPLGYDVDAKSKKLVVNEREAQAVRMIFAMYHDGFSYTEILKELNSCGYQTKRGGKFGKNSLYEILKNEKYIGVYTYNKSAAKGIDGKYNRHSYKDDSEIIRIENGIPAIIDKALFTSVQEKMKRMQRRSGVHNARETYLLSGKIFCGECGSPFTGNCRKERDGHPKYVSYRCSKKNGKASCHNKEIRREKIEELVLKRLADKIFKADIIPLIAERINSYAENRNLETKSRMDNIRLRLKTVEKEIKNVVNVIASTGSMALNEKLAELEHEQAELTQEQNRLEAKQEQSKLKLSEVKRLFKRAKQLFAQGTLASNKKLIDLFVKRVVIYPDRIEIQFNILPPTIPPKPTHEDSDAPSAFSIISDILCVHENRNMN